MILLRLLNHCSGVGTLRRAFALQHESLPRLAPIFAYIEEHADEPIRIKDAARMCATSPCSFMNLFKQVTGQSFVAYLNEFRVKKAQDLLVNTNKSIAEISLEVGFCNQSYFTVVFRQIVGDTPLAFRLANTADTAPRRSKRQSDFSPIPSLSPSLDLPIRNAHGAVARGRRCSLAKRSGNSDRRCSAQFIDFALNKGHNLFGNLQHAIEFSLWSC